MTKLLAFDTGTERMSVAVQRGSDVWSHEGAGGAKASATLIPVILGLMREAGLALAEIDAIAFGRGPGAFTGLRTACSVAQGLALGAGLPVLPIDSLCIVAESARGGAPATRVWATIDARMNQIYATQYAYADGRWQTLVEPCLTDAEALVDRWRIEPPGCVAGDALRVFADRLHTGSARRVPEATSSAVSMLPLAEAAWLAGEAVDAALALPVYVRDKVAETTAERAARNAATTLP